MQYLLLPLGLAVPTSIGWLLLKLLEGKSPVLFAAERVIAGFLVGSVLVPFCWFIVEVTGIGSFSLVSMAMVQLVLLVALGGVYAMKRGSLGASPILEAGGQWLLWQKCVAFVLGIWFALKVASAWLLLIGPAFFDDTVKNWNLRGKMFYVQKELILEAVPGKGISVGTYPPTVPLMKTWFANIAGSWTEPIVSFVHMLWYLAALALLFYVLRRLMKSTWAALGTYLLSSLPLYLLHGGAAYADQFLSAIIFLAVAWLFLALRSVGPARSSFLKLSAVATGLLIFTKNEALILHMPPIVLLVGLAAFLRILSKAEIRTAATWYLGSILVVSGPWLGFKWAKNLTFGNAKSASGMLNLQWHENVLETIFLNNFFMGHWHVFMALFVGILIACRKVAFKTPLVVCTAFFLIVFLGQIPLYLLTDLYTEAINQTGYARGVLHLIPLAVLVTTVCLHDRLAKK